MENRIQIDTLAPKAYRGMFVLENFLKESDLKNVHLHLIKIRASQLNKCAFCIDMHTKAALKEGESERRIFLLDACKETDLFTYDEKVILQITEEVTLIHHNGLTKETYDKAFKTFGPSYLSQVIMAITTINAWNRIAISTLKPIQDRYDG